MTSHCEHCGAKIVEYKHGLTKVLVRGLVALAALGGRGKTAELDEKRSVMDNFQKLRYFQLVRKTRTPGVWTITDLGYAFLNKDTQIYEYVWTFRGEVVRYEGSAVWIDEVVGVQTWEDWHSGRFERPAAAGGDNA